MLCSHCHKDKLDSDFISKLGKSTKQCAKCRLSSEQWFHTKKCPCNRYINRCAIHGGKSLCIHSRQGAHCPFCKKIKNSTCVQKGLKNF